MYSMHTADRMNRTAVVVGRKVGGAHDGKRGSPDHVVGGGAVSELGQRFLDNKRGVGLFDKSNQRFYLGGETEWVWT